MGFDKEIQGALVNMTDMGWQESLDHSEENVKNAVSAKVNFYAEYEKQLEVAFNGTNWQDIKDQFLKRRFQVLEKPGLAALGEEDNKQLDAEVRGLEAKRHSVICPYDKRKDCDKKSFDDSLNALKVERLMRIERRNPALVYYWNQWRGVASKDTKDSFKKVVYLLNKAAKDPKNGFDSAKDMWLEPYVSHFENTAYGADDFEKNVDALVEEVRPLYQKLLAYVRYRLRKGGPFKKANIKPKFPERKSVKGNHLFDYMHKVLEQMGLGGIPAKFKTDSRFVLNRNLKTECYPSLWDFNEEKIRVSEQDVRLLMCLEPSMEDMRRVVQASGELQYSLSYLRNPQGKAAVMPTEFRRPANQGMLYAVSGAIGLSVWTLQGQIDMFNYFTDSATDPYKDFTEEQKTQLHINHLMREALFTLPAIPHAYVMDKFRWDAFSGASAEEDWLTRWWTLMVKEQMVKPPVARNKDMDFDPVGEFPVANNLPAIGILVGGALKYQIHDHLCTISGNYENRSRCDFTSSKKAGKALQDGCPRE